MPLAPPAADAAPNCTGLHAPDRALCAAQAAWLRAVLRLAPLAWLLHKHPQLIAIPGARKLPHLRANAAAAELALSAAEVAELDAMFDPAKVSGARYPDAGWAGIER